MVTMTGEETFCAFILPWARRWRPAVVRVESVATASVEWDRGDTEAGFWSEEASETTVRWTDAEGRTSATTLSPDDAASLWQWVVSHHGEDEDADLQARADVAREDYYRDL